MKYIKKKSPANAGFVASARESVAATAVDGACPCATVERAE